MIPSALAARYMRNLACTAAYSLSGVHSSSGIYTYHKLFSTEEGGPTVAIDRSNLFNAPEHSHAPLPDKEPETELTKQLKALIRFRGGPITVAEYMSEVLTNPTAGYYTRRDVFGREGDFITSPEVSQLFGEMVGVWCVLQWRQLGSPHKLHLVELGPGRGTLMADLLRGTAPLHSFSTAVDVHLVEVSDALKEKQQQALSVTPHSGDDGATASGLTGAQVRWHRSLDEVPTDAPAVFIAHEFFDALPVHQFEHTDRGWCERLVDLAPPASPLHLQMVLSPGPTPASKLLVPRRLAALPPGEAVQQLEVSAQSIALAESLAKRLAEQGGAALVVDYGQDRPYSSSLQAIKQHGFVHLLSSPGNADLSCRLDFSALRQGVAQSGGAVAHGPIPQAHFLAGLGIEARLDALVEASSSQEQQASLISGFNRLVGGSEHSSETSQAAIDQSPAAESASDMNAPETDGHAIGEAGEVAESDGMGFTYKVMAITAQEQPPPLPFPGSGVTFE